MLANNRHQLGAECSNNILERPVGIQTFADRFSIIFNCESEFRLLDADGNAYYKDVCKHLRNQCDDNAFEPLDWPETPMPALKCNTEREG